MHEDLCSYSIYSLQFYLLFPLVKIGQLIRLPGALSYLVALSAPILALDYIIKKATKTNHVTLVKHSPKPDHPHSKAITIGVIFRSAILGVLLSIGLSFIDGQLQQHFIPMGIYLVLLSFFHFSEYFVTSLTNPSTLCLSSFLIEQSLAYVLAISGSFVEYTLEVYLFPDFKKFNLIALMGLVLAVVGELIRKLAMFTAGRNFSHTISAKKSPNHELVTHGIYSLFRHPSYAGWFYWAIGTQILLQNPICFVLFTVISYQFFKSRIIYEETILVEFFGKQYEDYRAKVGLWMPISKSI